MTEEEKKAIEMIKEQKAQIEHGIIAMETNPEDYEEDVYNDFVEWNKNAETVLNLIKKQQEEIEKKDKIIDLMARAIDNYDSQLVINTFRDTEHVKEYFKKKVEDK